MVIPNQNLQEQILEEPEYYSDRPDILNRGTLQLTVKFIRKENPSLALSVQNQMGQISMPINKSGNHHNRAADYFHVTLSNKNIKLVLDALSSLAKKLTIKKHQTNILGQLIMLKALLHDWLRLAEFIIVDELNKIEINNS